MNRRIRRQSPPSTTRHDAPGSGYLRYLKPGALAKLRDSRINARSHRFDSQSLQICIRRTPPSSPASSPASIAVAQVTFDGLPCFVGRFYGPRCPQRKKLVAAKSVFFTSTPVPDTPDPIDMFSNDFLVAH